MAKTLLQEIVKGTRRRERTKKRWKDNFKEWTGMEFGDSLRAAEDRERWKMYFSHISSYKIEYIYSPTAKSIIALFETTYTRRLTSRRSKISDKIGSLRLRRWLMQRRFKISNVYSFFICDWKYQVRVCIFKKKKYILVPKLLNVADSFTTDASDS